MKRFKRYWVYIAVVIIIAGIVGWYSDSQKIAFEASINSFEDCAGAGYPIMESYPEQCRTPGGKHFVREIENQAIVISGEMACLPHKGDGPHTLECAFGLKVDDGYYYSLSYPPNALYPQSDIGEKVTVTGLLNPPQETQYDIVGSINVEFIE